MRKFFKGVWNLYYDGFRSMTLGKTLWALILIKLFVIFAILKLFFFPSFLGDMSEEEASRYVSGELMERAVCK